MKTIDKIESGVMLLAVFLISYMNSSISLYVINSDVFLSNGTISGHVESDVFLVITFFISLIMMFITSFKLYTIIDR